MMGGTPMGQRLQIGFVVAVLITPIIASPANDCVDELKDLEGWTIVAVRTVDGTFEGCDHDKLIEFTDGTELRCGEYGYHYAYRPEAVIFAKSSEFGGESYVAVKMMVEDEVFDMRGRKAP